MFYIKLNDTDGGVVIISLVNITILNNIPVITNPQNNATVQMYRSQTIQINLTGTDVEDNPPNDLTAILCINRSDSSWYNTSIPYISGDFFEVNFVIPNDDVYLGLIKFYIKLNDTDGGVSFISLVNITILNNIPVITNPQNNATAQMYRSQTIQVNLTGTDVEDNPPNDLTAILCINRSDSSWYNISIPYISGDFFEINFVIPNDDVYLGFTMFYIKLNDTEGGVAFISLVNITILNNIPIITNPQHNMTAQMYRSQTIQINLTGTDVEDSPPNDLTAILCINRSDNSWYNTSIPYISGKYLKQYTNNNESAE